MTEYTFGPGEKKLAQAFELIVSLQEGLFTLKAQNEIDAQVLAALIATHPEPKALFDVWRRISSESLPAELTRNFATIDSEQTRDAVRQRTAWWNEVLRAAAGHGSHE